MIIIVIYGNCLVTFLFVIFVIYGHCLVTLPCTCTIIGTVKMAHIAAHLNAEIILVVTVCSGYGLTPPPLPPSCTVRNTFVNPTLN